MILIAELFFCVSLEISILGYRDVRRIQKDEIPRLRIFAQHILVITANDRRTLKHFCRLSKGGFITDVWILISRKRCVESALFIHSVETVITSLIEIDHSSSCLTWLHFPPIQCPRSKKTFFRVFIAAQKLDNCFDIVSNLRV